MGLPFETWKADTPLGDFEGVEVGEDGLVAVLNFSNFSQKEDLRFEMHSFQQLVSLKEINFSGCRNAIGEVLVKMNVTLPLCSRNCSVGSYWRVLPHRQQLELHFPANTHIFLLGEITPSMVEWLSSIEQKNLNNCGKFVLTGDMSTLSITKIDLSRMNTLEGKLCCLKATPKITFPETFFVPLHPFPRPHYLR